MKNRKSTVTFFRTFFVSLLIMCVFGVICVMAYQSFSDRFVEPPMPPDGQSETDATVEKENKEGGGFLSGLFSDVPVHTNFAVFGKDETANHTDFMMVGCFNSQTYKIDLISIPRDTYVVMPPERVQALYDAGQTSVSESGVMKMTEVYHHAGEELGGEYATMQLEDLLGIEIGYYVVIDTEAFRYLVDAMGGVEFDVPVRMYYHDPTQDLVIDLQPGLQTLNGADAEGLVRYRADYADADLQRMQVQQDFIKAMFEQLLAKENLVKNLPAMASTAIKYVDTNVELKDLPPYLKYVDKLSAESLATHMLPGEAEYIGSKSYFIMDEVEAKALVDSIFYESKPIEESGVVTDSKDKQIQVLNGSDQTGVAKECADTLTADGYTIANVGDYSGTKTEHTRLFVKQDGWGLDLLAYFPDSTIEVDTDLDYDIVIVLGETVEMVSPE